MKIGSAVFGLHIAVLCVFSLTQGCLTTVSKSSSRGAQHKGPFHHVHKGKTSASAGALVEQPVDMGEDLGGTLIVPMEPIDVAPITPTPFPATSATDTYIVRKGDTISQLAVDFDTTTAELVRLNNLANPDVLYVGQELVVPAGRGAATGSTSVKKPSVKKGGTYTIRKGDTLSGIAVAAGVSINDLRALNNIEGDMIRAGDTIDIPAGGKVPTTTGKTPTETAPEVVKTSQGEPELQLPEIAPATEDAPEGTAPASFDLIEEYIYYPSESLEDIAREYGVSKAEIMRLNGISDESQIKAGQTLRIPISE